jgi:hypothetical protein
MFLPVTALENGKADSSSDAHLQSSQSTKSSYLDPELSIFVILQYLNSFS